MSQPTVLIVEDDQDTRETLRDALEDEGYRVRCAGNGREGMEALQQLDPPCAVVLDLIMPLMSGDELYAAMQSDPRLAHIPVIISTSDPTRAPSGVALLRKPIDLAAMLSTVGRLCQ